MVPKFLNYILNNIPEIITTLVALYWAVLSTINYLKNKWRLKIDFNYHVFQNRIFWWKREDDKMILSISNVWNQVETIQNIWFFVSKDRLSLIKNIDKMIVWKIAIFPKKLNPSDRITIQFKKKEVVSFLKKIN